MKNSIIKPIVISLFLLLMVLSGLATEGLKEQEVSLGKEFETYKVSSQREASIDTIGSPVIQDTISLKHALSMAMKYNPVLTGVALEVKSAEARAIQEGLKPNPEFELEFEDFSHENIDDSRTSIGISQSFELGGKRRKRTEVALQKADIAGWDYEANRLDVFTSTTQAFIEVVAAQEKRGVAKEFVDISEQILDIISRRVEAGRDSPVEEIQAQMELVASRLELKEAGNELLAAKQNLAAHWGGASPTFEGVKSDLDSMVLIQSLNQLKNEINQNPDIARLLSERELLLKTGLLERVNSIPDLEVSIGMEHSNALDEITYRFGLGIPIPLFNRNQGIIAESGYNNEKAKREYQALKLGIQLKLTVTHQALETAYEEAIALRDDIIPMAIASFEGISQGFQVGRYSYLEVLEAQRTLFELKMQYIEAITDYQMARAEVERLIGKSLDSVGL